jgi:hypothetical protein
MNDEFVDIESILIRPIKKNNVVLKKGTVMETRTFTLNQAEKYFQSILVKRERGGLPSIEFGNPSQDGEYNGYGLDKNGLLVKGGAYYYESVANRLTLKERKITPKTTTKTESK